MTEMHVSPTDIEGLLLVTIPVHGDNRGWFKENWQRDKMVSAGLPDFNPIQNNVSFNATAGATRGVHAEPWDKLVSVATGRIFGIWVDLREGDGFGKTVSLEMGPETAVYVPRGVGNGFQTLEDATAYSYLVNEHWSAAARASYTFLNLADPLLASRWPIQLEDAELSAADREHPMLAEVEPVRAPAMLIVGADGQLGTALRELVPKAQAADLPELDLTDRESVGRLRLDGNALVVNAAAYTAVDTAEEETGRRHAWAVNVAGVGNLVQAAARHRTTLVHVSSDYVFDGTRELHDEAEAFSPTSVYGQTKAAGDALVATLAQHYIVRTSWVVGNGKNFVRTMADLAGRGVDPSVIDDQFGRLTFSDELARGIVHLVESRAPYGTYNLTGTGDVASWYEIAATIFELLGHPRSRVTPVSTAEYAQGRTHAPRPRHSALDLAKIRSTGLEPRDWRQSLEVYLSELPT